MATGLLVAEVVIWLPRHFNPQSVFLLTNLYFPRVL